MNRLKELRHNRGVSQQVIADLLNVTKATYSRYESGQFEPAQASLIRLADYFHVTIDYLLKHQNVEPTFNASTKIPIFHQITSYIPLHAETNIDGYEEIPLNMSLRGNYFALHAAGKSMEPEIHDQDVVIIRRQDSINSGDTAVVFLGTGNAVIRNIEKTENGMLLIAYNLSICRPHFYTQEDLKKIPIKIIGRVMEIRRKIS
jgi:repressor LexA